MKDIEVVDARGKECPQPVIMAKKAIERHDRIVVLVDNEIALENVKRLAAKVGCITEVEKKDDGAFQIRMSKAMEQNAPAVEDPCLSCNRDFAPAGPFVIVISDNRMGRGSDELGNVLIRTFLHTLCQQEVRPDAMIFYNTGVKLTVKDSEVIEDLKQLAGDGVEILVCGTCVNYFNITRDVAVGTISNMYDIAGLMSRAGRLVNP